MINAVKFAQFLKAERDKKQLKNAELAKMAKVTTATIATYLSGGGTPSLNKLVTILNALGYTLYIGKKKTTSAATNEVKGN